MRLLERHFEMALAAPDGIKKLRELILTLAMQGKLVPQDPADQPASELLKQIEAEKKKLIKEGKIKKQEPLPPIKPEEVLYEVPAGWEWVRLNDIAEYNGRPNLSPAEITSEMWVLDLEDLEKDSSRILHRAKYSERESKSTKSVFYAGDVLYGKLRPYLNKVVVADKEGVCTTEIVPIVPCVGVFSNYLQFLLKRPDFLAYVNSKSYGVKMPRLGTTDAIVSIHPLPPLAEQKRIVDKIDQLMAVCDRLEAERNEQNQKRFILHRTAMDQLLSAADAPSFADAWNFIVRNFSVLYSVPENLVELKKAILQLAVMGKLVPQDPVDQPASELLKQIEAEKKKLLKEGKIKKQEPLPPIKPEEVPYELPAGWEWVRVQDLVDVGTGSTPTKSNSEYYSNGSIPWYTSSATNNPVAETPEVNITEKALLETNCRIFPAGSLIIALYGQGKTRGQISEIVVAGATNQAIAAMVFLNSSEETKAYLKYFFVKIYEEIRLRAEGAAQPNLNIGKIKNTIVPLPPLAEQKRIVAKVDSLLALCDTLEQQLKDATDKQTAILNAVVAGI